MKRIRNLMRKAEHSERVLYIVRTILIVLASSFVCLILNRAGVMKENILLSQRVESFSVEVRQNGLWQTVYQGTVIGYKKIVPLKPVEGDALRITIEDARVCPTLAFVGVY